MDFFKRIALVAAAALALAAPSSAGTVIDADPLERPLLAAINSYRASHGLAPLRASRPLAAAALAHSRAMATHGFFSHSSADGTAFWRRIQRHYASNGFGSWRVGENLLWSGGTLTAERALQMWIDSPGHRKVLLTAAYRDMGSPPSPRRLRPARSATTT